jgi:antitoxin FitA
MANVLIRDIPDEVIKELKQRAKSRNRPLQQELREILVTTAHQPYEDIVQRAAEIRLKLTEKHRAFTDSAELLREDRAR